MTIRIRMKKDFVGDMKKGVEFDVEKADNDKVYYAKDRSGNPFYVPKIMCEVLTTTKGSTDSGVNAPTERIENVGIFDTTDALQPVPNDLGMSAQEKAVIDALTSGKKLKRSEDDGPTTETSFEPDITMTIAEKEKAQNEKRLKRVRDLLDFTGTPILKEGQFWLSDLTEGRLPKSNVDRVVTSHVMMHWEQDKEGKWWQVPNTENPWYDSLATCDIPEIDEFYVWDATVLESIVLGMVMNERVLLTGPPGTGKTSAIKQFAAWTNHPYMRFNGKDGIEQSSFLGQIIITDGEMVWKDGVLPIGLKEEYIICLDEIFKIPPGIQMAMQALYERGGFLMLDDKPGTLHEKMIWPEPNARLYLTDNVKGTGDGAELFASTQMQDTSTIDRFGLTCDVNYLPERMERLMLSRKYPTAKTGDVNKLVQFANLVREAYNSGRMALTMSPRGLFVTMDLFMDYDIPMNRALDMAFVNKLSDDVELGAIKGFQKTCWR